MGIGTPFGTVSDMQTCSVFVVIGVPIMSVSTPPWGFWKLGMVRRAWSSSKSGSGDPQARSPVAWAHGEGPFPHRTQLDAVAIGAPETAAWMREPIFSG